MAVRREGGGGKGGGKPRADLKPWKKAQRPAWRKAKDGPRNEGGSRGTGGKGRVIHESVPVQEGRLQGTVPPYLGEKKMEIDRATVRGKKVPGGSERGLGELCLSSVKKRDPLVRT